MLKVGFSHHTIQSDIIVDDKMDYILNTQHNLNFIDIGVRYLFNYFIRLSARLFVYEKYKTLGKITTTSQCQKSIINIFNQVLILNL